MINVNELRIGNRVNIRIETPELKETFLGGRVTGINNDSVYVNNIKVPLNNLKLIPLAYEILDKIGSLIENRDRYYFKDGGFFDKTNENYTFLESTPMIMQPGEDPDKTWINVLVGVGRGHTEIYIASLLYVHQLQNIYYDIFQKELSVEL